MLQQSDLELRAGFPEGLKVLLVEADNVKRESIQQQLLQCQYQVCTCENMGEALLRQKQQEFEVILIEMSNYLFSQSDSSISQRQEFGRSVGATYTPIILTATTQQLPQAQKLVATPKQELSEEYLPIQAVLEFPLDSLQIKNLWQYKVKCLLQNHGVIGRGVVKNKKCEVSGTSIQNVTTSGEGVDSEVTSIVRFTNGQGSGELDMSQYSEGQPSKQSSQPAIGAPQPAQSKQRKRRIESTDTGSPTKKPQLAYKVPFQLHPQPLLPSMPMGMFNNSWVPPPPAPGAVWGCPVPPGLCLGGHNLTAQALPPPLMIQHPFLGHTSPHRNVKENDSMFLCLVGIGTLIIGDDEMKQMAKDLDIVSNARMAAQLGDPKVGRASSDIVLILDRDL
eukprot:TRINITY_DN12645_c0_g1_i4.p1 TRINITY_DN12645_c0_g1~~TRINITY_DN12645_c0_g1_i4.p1  ORF type:complete len:392 (+),score=70.58 TRINITY_DN12645_c0_g1_i4:132-1307(+)